MKSLYKVYLINTSNDLLIRRVFYIFIKLLSRRREARFEKYLINYKYTNIYIIINKSLIPRIYYKLNLNFISLLILKPLRDYNKRLLKRFIIYYILFIINVTGYKKSIYFILTTPLNIYNIILKKS